MFPLRNIRSMQKVQKHCLLQVRDKDKREITSPFTVSITQKFLQIQLFYEDKTRCIVKFNFPADFNVTFSNNHWLNTGK